MPNIYVSSGGNPLNFKVVGGTTQPSNPKENTIWVNTDAEITEWHIGKYPNPNWNEVDGKVFINIETTSDVSSPAFNALKKNGLRVRPYGITQRISGVWVRKAGAIYQNGAWAVFKTVLFDGSNGGDVTAITGGWDGAYRSSGSGSVTSTALVSDSAKNYSRYNFQTKNKIDMTPYKTAIAYFTKTTSSYGSLITRYIGLNTTKYTGDQSTALNDASFLNIRNGANDAKSGNFTLQLDLSNVSGAYYFNVYFGSIAETCYKIELLC